MPTIYMPLLNEGTEAWRPVEASRIAEGTYRIEGQVPDGEEWAFPPGASVRCELKTFTGGEPALVAISAET
jgi:hypothetical protein